jgi:hypothetical protein
MIGKKLKATHLTSKGEVNRRLSYMTPLIKELKVS